MSVLFINGSPNKNGNTTELANTLMDGKDYRTLHLVDYKLYGYGQSFADDQFAEILESMKEADTIVIGSPVYWHSMCGLVRNLLDRFYGPVVSPFAAAKVANSSGSAKSAKKLIFADDGFQPLHIGRRIRAACRAVPQGG